MDFDTFSDDAFSAYLAGFTDGEGYIGLENDKKSKKTFVRIIIANCVKDVLVAIQQRLGYGAIRSQKLKENWRERFTLDIANLADCENYLLKVRPYLKIKASIADEALDRIGKSRQRVLDRYARNEAIKAAALSGEMRKNIAKRFNLSPQAISLVIEGHKWPSERSRIAKARKRSSLGRFAPIQHNEP